jgi:peptidoglycan/xylan/chitin deacetylase (PgdA/CDA1 family)/SAM-dependent methyltransferase
MVAAPEAGGAHAMRIGAVIRCGDVPRHVYATVAALEHQSRTVSLVLVTDTSTPPAARAWIRALADAKTYKYVHVDATAPGLVWNAGIEALGAEIVICLSANTLLDPHYAALASAPIESGKAAIVSCGVIRLGPGAARHTLAPIDWMSGPLTSPIDVRDAPLTIAYDVWHDLGRFDETLATLEDLEFCCRAVASGHHGVSLQQPLAVQPNQNDAPHVRGWSDDRRPDAIARIAARHAKDVHGSLGAVFQSAELFRASLRARNQQLIDRRAREMAELEALRASVERLRSMLTDADVKSIDMGDVRRTSPVSRDWGYGRGGPIDRVYIERFLGTHQSDIAGAVLEVQESDYTRRYGGDRVTRSDVVDLDPENPRATILADLRSAANIPSNTYDCVIVTQTLHVIEHMDRVAAECARILKPGGVLLATLPSASRVCVEYGFDGDFWRVTEAGARRVFSSAFSPDRVTVEACGNVLVNAAFLYGLGAGELSAAEYEARDPYFPMLITVRAQKPPVVVRDPAVDLSRALRRPFDTKEDLAGGAILLYHRVAARGSDVHKLAIPPDEFRAQMDHVREHYVPMSLGEFVRAAQRHALPPGAIAVTFDDGYIDNLTTASPIVAERGIPATFFLTTDRLEQPCEFWWDQLERWLLGPSARSDAADLTVSLPDGARMLSTATVAQRLEAHWIIYHAIVGAAAEDRDRAIEDVRQWAGDPAAAAESRRMTREEIGELARRPGHDVGAHTVRHLMLPRQSDDVRCREIVDSRRVLADLTGASVAAFAYPFGAFDVASQDALRAAGFEIALICGDSAVPRHPDVFALPRLDPAARGPERFDDWLARRAGPPVRSPRPSGRGLNRGLKPAGYVPPRSAPACAGQLPHQPGNARRALVAGWFSCANSDSTAGDHLVCDVVCEWLAEAGFTCDVALARPFTGGVDIHRVDPSAYSHAVFVCGPFMPNEWEREFVTRFASCTIVGVNLSLPVPLAEWNPFQVLIERDSDRLSRPDIAFAANEPGVPVIGVCLVEPYDGADTAAANAAIARLLASRHVAIVPIDTRLDINAAGLRTKAEIESLLAKMDAVVTTRLHGTVLALKHGVPVVAIDPEPGGFRIRRQSEAIGWPTMLTVDALDERQLSDALDYCLTDAARQKALEVRDRAIAGVIEIRRTFIDALGGPARR